MKDDIIKKLQTLLSGSSDVSKKLETKIQEELPEKNESANEEMVSNFMSQILDSAWVEDELKSTTTPSYMLSKKEKSYWLMNNSLKIFVNIKGGVELIPIDIGEKNSICMIGFSMFTVPNDLLIYNGWN